MTDKVVNILDYKPHMTGKAICLHCKHEWVAVSPVGVDTLECSECGLMKGVYSNIIMPETAFQCGCGNCFFVISPDNFICTHCGDIKDFEDLS